MKNKLTMRLSKSMQLVLELY